MVTVIRKGRSDKLGCDLWLFATKRNGNTCSIYLGQEAKVMARILGWDYTDPRSEFGRIATYLHLPKKPRTEKSGEKCMKKLMRGYAYEILDALGMTEDDLWKVEPWELHVGGG